MISATLCTLCGHTKDAHRGVVCGEKSCQCLCYLDMSTASPPLEPIIEHWGESIMMAVLDCIVEEREGVIHVKTNDGRECHVKVEFVSEEIGYNCIGVGIA